MVELCDGWDAMADDDLPLPLHRYSDENTTSTTPRTVCAPEYVSEVFARLVLNQEIMREMSSCSRKPSVTVVAAGRGRSHAAPPSSATAHPRLLLSRGGPD
jgi:hypothetical protein